jgi:hypothetical protein
VRTKIVEWPGEHSSSTEEQEEGDVEYPLTVGAERERAEAA